MIPELYDHQKQIRVDVRMAARRFQSILVYGPTGVGKTNLSAALIKSIFDAGKRVIFAVHRADLLHQTALTFKRFGIPFSYIAAGQHYNPYHRVFIASIPTLQNRLGKYPADWVFIDEAHLSASAGWSKTIAHYKSKGAKLIGLTGSPERLDGKPLGDVWDTLVLGPSTRWLIENGFLSRYRAFAPAGIDLTGVHVRGGDYVQSEIDDLMAGKAVLAGAVKHWRKYAAGKRTIAFAPSVKRAEALAAEFREHGVMAVSIDGTTPSEDRKAAFNAFADGYISVITSVNLFCEGFDLAAQVDRDVTVEAVLLYRPTQSLALHLQQIGRALRKKPEPAIILDLVGNLARLGLPDEEREWSLAGRDKKSAPSVMICEQCFASHDPAPVCPECGFVYPKKEKDGPGLGRVLDEVDGELEEIDIEAMRRERKIEQAKARTLDDLVKLATARGYKSPEKWAAHVFTARQAKRGIAA